MTRSNLGSLVTTFTPPVTCSIFGANGLDSTGAWWIAQGCTSGVLHDNPSCWPTATLKPTDVNLNGFGFYSPGLICPVGYQPACTAAAKTDAKFNPSWLPQFPLTAGETATGCCPTGFSCKGQDSQGSQTCVSHIESGTATIGTCTLGSFNIFPVSVGDGFQFTDGSGSVSSTTITEANVYAPLIQLVYRDQDTSLTATTTSTSATPHTPSTLSIAAPTGSSQAATDSPVLSSEAKIGIGVGAGLVVLLAVLALFIFIGRRRSRRNHHIDVFGGPLMVNPVEKRPQYSPVEMSAAQKTQMSAELDGSVSQRLLAEMPSR